MPSRRASALVVAIVAAAHLPSPAPAQPTFTRHVIENIAGDVKLAGDIDLDGFADIVLGGMPFEGLNWYRYVAPAQWTKTFIDDGSVEFTTDGRLGDIDGDGDLDIVIPDGPSGDNVLWYENPKRNAGAPDGDPFVGANWTRRSIGPTGSWAKDVHLADYDFDGRLDVATRRDSEAYIFFQTAPLAWSRRTFSAFTLGSEGMTSGDLDGDGDADLVLRGVWLQNPGAPGDPDKTERTRVVANWSQHTIAASGIDGSFKAFVVDLDRNGAADVLFSSSESSADIRWHTPQTAGAPTGPWTSHLVVAAVERAHTLQAADMDRDGDIDVVVGQMHSASAPELAVYRNVDGSGGTLWTKQVVETSGGVWSGIHNGVVADVGADGDNDILGADFTGHPPLIVWENTTPAPESGAGALVR